MSGRHGTTVRARPNAVANKPLPSATKKRKRQGSCTGKEGGISTNSHGTQQLPLQDVHDSRPFACPFYKKSPLDYRSCSNFEMERISHIKQHINRKHRQPAFCPKCGTKCQTKADRDDHIREADCLKSEHIVEPDGITEDQQEALKRRVPSKLSREQQWYYVFDIVCPKHQPRPLSPYQETVMCEDTLAHIREYGPEILMNRLRQEDQWPLEVHPSLLEPMISRAMKHTIDQFASIGSGCEDPPESSGTESLESSATPAGNQQPESFGTPSPLPLLDASEGWMKHFDVNDHDFGQSMQIEEPFYYGGR